jgi:dienelactone hydrolase
MAQNCLSAPNPIVRLAMNRLIVVCLAVLFCATPCFAEVDLAFPSQPEHDVKVPPRGAQTGARLYAPEGPGPFPAVVLSHTSGPLQQHMFQWAKRLLGAGYAVVIVDHLGPRRKTTNTDHSVSVTEYAQDDVAALRHLRSLPFVDGKRIAQMGLSYGAMTGLREASKEFRTKYLGGERFAAIVSVYPWCNQQVGNRFQDHQWNFYDDTDIPLLVIVGADDDEADPRSCIDKAKENAAKGLPVELTVLPGTTHAFDHTWMKTPMVSQQAGHSVTHRYNPEAVESTWKLTSDFLARRLGGTATN